MVKNVINRKSHLPRGGLSGLALSYIKQDKLDFSLPAFRGDF